MARKRLGEILIEAGLLEPAGLTRALGEQKRWGGQLGRVLVDLELVEEESLVAALSHQMNMPTVDISSRQIPREVLDIVDSEFAEENQLVPFAVEGKFLDLAMSNPTNMSVIDELRMRTQLNVRTYLAGPVAIEKALARWYGVAAPADESYDPTALFSDERVIEMDEPEGDSAAERTARSKEVRQLRLSLVETVRQVQALQERLSKVEGLLQRDEGVIRKLLLLLIDKQVATREEILSKIS